MTDNEINKQLEVDSLPDSVAPGAPAIKEELVRKYLEERELFMKMLKARSAESLYIFNKYVLKCQEGAGKVDLAPFHKEICKFVQERRDRKKLLLVPRGHLKALKTVGTRVLTPFGFRDYKDLRVGDEIIGENGLPVRVKNVHPEEKMKLYKVTTNDGREIICNGEHLFKVRLRQNSRYWKVRSLNWIKERYSKERLDKRNGVIYYEHPVQLNPVKIFYKEKLLPIDSYTLGMWLGDGHSAGSRMTTADPEIFNFSSFKWHKFSKKYLYGTYGLQKILRLNGLINNKHIPREYFTSGYEQRLELLRGLMDTDGTCHCQGGIAYFSNTNYQLITDVVELVRSLGGVAIVCKVNQLVNGLPYDTWTVSVKLPDDTNPFKLKRKAKCFTGLKTELTINIVGIEPVEDSVANCITVGGDGTFIANDYFPTHNSTLVTIGYSLFRIVEDINVRILILNETWQVACDFLTEIKNHMQKNEMFIELYGDLTANASEWANDRITLNRTDQGRKGPTVWAAGVESGLVGTHPDVIIMDDLVGRNAADSEDMMNKTIKRYKDALDLLEPGGSLIAIGTRWTDRDLYEWILNPDNGVKESFDIMVKPAFKTEFSLSEVFAKGSEGEGLLTDYLWPQKYNFKELADRYREKGPYEFSTQYLNEAVPDEEADFRKDWFKYIDGGDWYGRVTNRYMTIDPAISLKKDADFTAIVIADVDGEGYILPRHIERVKVTPAQLIDLIFRLSETWHPNQTGIEMVAFQKTLQYSLNEEMQKRHHRLPIVELKIQDRSKDERIRSLQPLYASGKILHDKKVANIEYLEQELMRFPRGKHDDVADAFASMLDLIVPPRVYTEDNKRYHHKYLYNYG